MRTHLEFNADTFEYELGGDEDPMIVAKELAEFLAEKFQGRGYPADVFAEDWGWMVSLGKQDFHLWLGCSSYGPYSQWLVFIEPSQPFKRKLFRKIDTQPAVERVAGILETVLIENGGATGLRWWSDHDSGRK